MSGAFLLRWFDFSIFKMQFNRLYLRTASCIAGMAFMAGTAWAVTPFTVRDIRIEGLQRVEPGTVFISLPVRVGDVYSDEKSSLAIRALFDLGLFKDVRIEVNGDVLVIVVEERPTIAEVDFVGTKEFDKDVLEGLARCGVGRWAAIRQGATGSRRAGTQKAIHQSQPLRGGSGDHSNPGGAKSGQSYIYRG